MHRLGLIGPADATADGRENPAVPWYRAFDENGKNLKHSWFIGFAPADHPQVAIAVNMCNPSDERFFIFRFIGTEGVISGTLGISKYPEDEPDSLTWSSNSRCAGLRFEAKLEETYLPDSFIGPIASLMQAIQENGVPETAGDDNLNTLRIAEAGYKPQFRD